MQTIATPATTAKTAPIKFTKPEQDRLAAAQSELARLDAKLIEVIEIKQSIEEIGRQFAAGKIDLVNACAILTASTEDRHNLQQCLKPHVKQAMRETIAQVGDLITKSRQHHLDELKRLAGGIETTERAHHAALGGEPDSFTPSRSLSGVREQHRRSLETFGNPPSRAELNTLTAGE